MTRRRALSPSSPSEPSVRPPLDAQPGDPHKQTNRKAKKKPPEHCRGTKGSYSGRLVESFVR